ncbi:MULTISPECIES: hypothetical protein [Nostoc]|uniref:Uncharacterized protein n=1 Tax=Nostoc paludosum FACHB-159 TaxID=2692908 RepID=A0ABR8KE93_9NOSO|nr:MULTISPECIES: hypothetical protein [Nostoc]MBD2680171.1 hypothetical protein [Nostoc sp. FACHB-857]MBD2736422.1 hypothetical protein [Nostoc paludosum FACHB-159]
MTIAHQNTVASLHGSNSVNPENVLKFVRLGATKAKAFWWHIHAYRTILAVMLLTLSSLIYLIIHWSLSKLLRVRMHRDEWKISSSK